MSRSNDGLPMLPPWLADSEVTGVGQTNFRNYEPPPVENLPQDQVIPEAPEPPQGYFNRRGRGDDRPEQDGEKKKGKGWFRNKNRDEPSLEDRVGELLPDQNGPRPSQRNNWGESTQQWAAVPAPDAAQAPPGSPQTEPPRQPGARGPGDPFEQHPGQGTPPPGQFPPAVPATPDQGPATHAPDGRPQWGADQQPPQRGPGAEFVPPTPGPPPLAPPPPPHRPGPDQPTGPRGPEGSGEFVPPVQGSGQAPATDRPNPPMRDAHAPATDFDQPRPNPSTSIPPQRGGPASSGVADPARPGTGPGGPNTGERGLLPPPPALPDPPATGPETAAQQPLRRLPDLPPAPPMDQAQTPADNGSSAQGSSAQGVGDTAGPGSESAQQQSPVTDGRAPHSSGAHPVANRGRSGDHAIPDNAATPDGAPPATGPDGFRAPESGPRVTEESFTPPPERTAEGPNPATGGQQRSDAAAQWRAPESTPANPPQRAPGPPRGPEQQASWQSGAQHPVQQPGPPPGPPQHGGAPNGYPAAPPNQQPNIPPAQQPHGQPPAQQWNNQQMPPGDPSVQQGGPGPNSGWQQQLQPGPQGGQQQFGPGGPTLDNVSVRRAKKPAGNGWRKVVHHASGGKINPGMSAEERRLQELVARIRQPVRGDYRIAVLSLKGGVGKTTTTIGLGSTFASVRGDRVIAVDANPDFGTLSQRVPLQTRSTVRDLLLDPAIQRYSDVRRHTSQATSRLEVLASERDPAASEAFNEGEYRAVARILQRFYNIILTDCGTGLMHSAMGGVLQLAHSLVLISPTAIDGAQSASATLDWLSLHGYHHLVQNAVVVINSPRDGTPNIDVQQLRQYFLSRCRAVHMIPFDPHMSEGAEIDLPRLKKETKRAYVELAATVADDFGRSYR